MTLFHLHTKTSVGQPKTGVSVLLCNANFNLQRVNFTQNALTHQLYSVQEAPSGIFHGLLEAF